jgi:site-specific DNA-methyltransferase (adenine-specific)
MTEPYYQDATTTLWLGDMREVLPALDIAPDLVVADPPYQSTSLAWDRWPEAWPGVVAKVASSMWCFGSMRMFLERRDEFENWRLSQDVVWDKQRASGFITDRLRRVHEHALHWYRGAWGAVHHNTPRVIVDYRTQGNSLPSHSGQADHYTGGKRAALSWTDDGTRLMQSIVAAQTMWRRGAIHPTEKPVALLRPLIEYACPPGGLVLDPFAGSGSTAAAARELGRRCVLVEADERYAEAIVNRLAQDVLPLEVAG